MQCDRKRVILCQRVRGSVRAVRVVRNTRVFKTETRVVADVQVPPYVQMLSGAPEIAVAESENTLQSSRGGWEYVEVLRSTGEGYRSVWVVCVWVPD